MTCFKCGYDNAAGTAFCYKCGERIGTTLANAQPSRKYDPYQPGNYENPTPQLIWGILNTILCCLPLGIVAIVFSAKVTPFTSQAEAEYSLSTAKTVNILATCIGAGLVIIVLFIRLTQ